jgi:hypothetical protein
VKRRLCSPALVQSCCVLVLSLQQPIVGAVEAKVTPGSVLVMQHETCKFLELAPTGAGEVISHGQVMKVHPRLSEMGHGFSGCQRLWLQRDGTWAFGGLIEVRDGKGTFLWERLGPWPRKEPCSSANSWPKQGAAQLCLAGAGEPLPSSAPGCFERFTRLEGASPSALRESKAFEECMPDEAQAERPR